MNWYKNIKFFDENEIIKWKYYKFLYKIYIICGNKTIK